MKLLNETPHAANMLRSEVKDDLLFAAVIAHVRYAVDEAGALTEQAGSGDDLLPAQIRLQVLEDDYGHLQADELVGRSGTDVIVLGDAVAEAPVEQLTVRVEAGPYGHEVAVYGDRLWEPGAGGLKPSAPEPFDRMPLSCDRAYGGQVETELGTEAYQINPRGKGFYTDEQQARGGPLPNLEDPQNPIQRWSDRPAPAGVGPRPDRMMHMERFLEQPREGRARFRPTRGFHDLAFPGLCGQRLEATDTISLHGIGRPGRLSVRLPQAPLEMEVQLGQRRYLRAMNPEEVLLDCRTMLLDLTYRKNITYDFVPHQKRRIRLLRSDSASF